MRSDRYSSLRVSEIFLAMFVLFLSPTGISRGFGQSDNRIDSDAHLVSIGNCFNSNIVEHLHDASTTDFVYQALSIVDYDLFTRISHDGKLKALFPYGFFDGSWQDFQERRQHYFEMNSESLSWHHAATLDSVSIPSTWAPVIQNCIHDVLTNGGSGLLYLPKDVDANRFLLEVKYRSSDNATFSPKVSSSEVDGGYIEEDGVRRTTLYKDCSVWYIACPRVNDRNEFLIHRTDPNRPVTITLNISGDGSKSTSFSVQPWPRQIKCVTHESTQEATTDFSPVYVRENFSGSTYGSGGWERDVWDVSFVAPGRVVNVLAHWSNPKDQFNWEKSEQRDKVQSVSNNKFQLRMDRDPDWKNSEVYIVGMKQDDSDTISATVRYLPTLTNCTAIDWPLPTAALAKNVN